MKQAYGLRINIIVGGRFHAEQLYVGLSSLGHDVHIYASSPPKYFRTVPNRNVTFVPKVAQVLQKVLKRRMPRWFHGVSSIVFDGIVSRIMRPADVIWGFNGDSLISGRRGLRRGGKYIVDRACPHILEQENLLKHEAAATAYHFAPLPKGTKTRFVAEYDAADLIVVPSNYSARSFPKQGISANRVFRAPLDVNFRAVSQQIQPAKDGAFRVGIVGGSFLRKGLIYLLRAIDQIGDPSIQLKIRASAHNVLQHPEAFDICSRNNVTFIGYLDDISDFYQSIDCFVLSSVDEGFGMVVYEALMNGTPIIASDHVGATDDLTDGQTFLKVPVANSEAIATAILKMREDPRLRARIATAGHEFYLARMQSGDHYSDFLERALERVRANKDYAGGS